MIRRSLSILVLITITFGVIVPFLWAIATSLMSMQDAYAYSPSFWPKTFQWRNYWDAFTQLPLARFLWNSTVLSLTCALGATLSSSMAGYALARERGWRGRILTSIVVSSLFIPGMMLMIPRFWLFSRLGWIGTYKPMIVPAWLGGGAFNVFLFRQSFRVLDPAYEDAALLDGATAWQTYRRVLLPMLRHVVAVAFFLSFGLHWNDFLDPLLYLSDFMTYPVALGLRMYQSISGTYVNELMAASLISLIPICVVFAACQSWIRRIERGRVAPRM